VTVVSGGEREYRGEAAWQPVLEGALKLLDKTDETTIRVVIGAHTIVVQSEGEETVAVLLPTGHAIAKSLRRMIRRLSRKARGPVVRPALQHLQPGAQPSAPGTRPAASTPPGAPAPEAHNPKPYTSWG
jgi:hypothetical protein